VSEQDTEGVDQIDREVGQPAGREVGSVSDLIIGGALLPITRWGEPVMHRKTKPVTYDSELHTLIRDMFATMAAADGVGLAAPQVGVDLALFVYDCPDEDRRRHIGVFCNPVVTLPEGKDRQLDYLDEGCLSLPGAYIELARPDLAVCSGQDAFGNDITVEGKGYFARCLQHETDHLNGTVFGDRLSARSRKKLYAQHRDVGARYPADWPVTPRTGNADS
jgi:peptide deformylase